MYPCTSLRMLCQSHSKQGRQHLHLSTCCGQESTSKTSIPINELRLCLQVFLAVLLIVPITTAALLKDAADRNRVGVPTYQRLSVGLIGYSLINVVGGLVWNMAGPINISSLNLIVELNYFAKMVFIVVLGGYVCALGERA